MISKINRKSKIKGNPIYILWLLPCQQHLEDPALQVGQEVQGGLSHRRDQFLLWVPKMLSHIWIYRSTYENDHKSVSYI